MNSKAFNTAWAVLTRGTVPSGDTGEESDILACLPLAGASIGAGACAVASLLIFATSNHHGAAALLSSLLVPGLCWWITKAAGLHGMIWTAERWAVEVNPEAGEAARYAPYWTMLAFQVAILIKVVATALLVYMNSVLWLWMAPALSAAAYADLLATRPAEPQHSPRLVAQRHWLYAGGIALVLSCLMRTLIAGIFVYVLVWLLTPKLVAVLQLRAGKLNDQERRTVVECVEDAVLFLGLVSAAGFSA